ncbi:MAG TPA: MBOAT family protein [Candidatus Anaerotruncus excrementipullorum]|uniref:MBOAT family protein n=1 Tax=Candidatus Anaerotruncus excrementipullorum TaxID=2838465 RepID=A0A9D1WRV9_9FIRM|nr:MBOAT family protein [Candidatus Anaerotruncus excrementipullorum]
MVFSSLLFLFRFLPITFAAYYLAPKRLKNLVLLIASLVFYSWGEVRYFPVMLAVILVNFFAGLAIERFDQNQPARRAIVVAALVFSIGWLAFFKYTNFFLSNLNGLFGLSLPYLQLTLPLGISFYTFQIMTYTVDVYARKVTAEHSIIDFGTFVVLFPQLIAGPIVKYSDISQELKRRTVTLAGIQEGIALFILGLGSKVLLANNVGALWSQVEALGFGSVSTALAWLALLAYALQIYFDFSGYSLMAIGMGKALGFTFPKNFDYPYISRSITEFWRRWHMTLGGWFREYVYIPLGGNRVKPLLKYRNMLVVWALTGLWHGASWNFVFWGLYSFALIALERLFLKRFLDKHRVISHVYALFAVLIGWVLFAITDLGQMGSLFCQLFNGTGGSDWMFYLRNYAVVLLLGMVFSVPVLNRLLERFPKFTKALATPFLMLVLVLSVAYLVDSTYNPFLYFRF